LNASFISKFALVGEITSGSLYNQVTRTIEVFDEKPTESQVAEALRLATEMLDSKGSCILTAQVYPIYYRKGIESNILLRGWVSF